MNHKILEQLLTSLKYGRSALIEPFTHEDPSFYTDIFNCEKSIALTELAINRFKLLFLLEQMRLLKNIIANLPPNLKHNNLTHIEKTFTSIQKEILGYSSEEEFNHPLYIQENLSIVESLLGVNSKSELNFKQLEFQLLKNKKKFEIEISKLRQEEEK